MPLGGVHSKPGGPSSRRNFVFIAFFADTIPAQLRLSREDAEEVPTKDANGHESEGGEEDFGRLAEFKRSGEWVLSGAAPAFPDFLRALRVLRG